MVALPLPFCCRNKIGQILWVVWEINSQLLELANSQRGKQAVKL
jgi:hypothetical protein